MNLFFLGVAGGTVHKEHVMALECAAIDIVCDKVRQKRIREDDFEGVVSTNFARGALCGIVGTIFYAELDMDSRTVKASFIMTDADKIEFEDERSHTAHMN